MTWSTSIAIAALLFAIAKFLDKFHNNSTWENRLYATTRNYLIAVFVFLDERRIRQVARSIFLSPVKYQLLSYGLALAVLTVYGAPVLLLFMIFITYFDVAFVGVSVGAFAALVAITGIIYLLRWSAKWMKDWVMCVLLPFTPIIAFLVVSLVATAYDEFIGFNQMGLLERAKAHVPYLVCLWLTVFPFSLAVFVVFLALVTKILLQCGRLIVLHVANGASNPKTDPFSYFAALLGILVLTRQLLLGGA